MKMFEFNKFNSKPLKKILFSMKRYMPSTLLFRKSEISFILLASLLISIVLFYHVYTWHPPQLDTIWSKYPALRGKSISYIYEYLENESKKAEVGEAKEVRYFEEIIRNLQIQVNQSVLMSISDQVAPFSFSFTHITVLFNALIFMYRLNALLTSGAYAILASSSGSRFTPLFRLLREWILIIGLSLSIISLGILSGYIFNQYIDLENRVIDAFFVIVVISLMITIELILAILLFNTLLFKNKASLAMLLLIIYTLILSYIRLVGGAYLMISLSLIRPADLIIYAFMLYVGMRYPSLVNSPTDLEAINVSRNILIHGAIVLPIVLILLIVVNFFIIKRTDLV